MYRRHLQKNKDRKGMALLLSTLMLIAIVPAVGLAIDVGLVFAVKGRLSSAVDSAAMAAGRSLNLGSDIAAANLSATTTANQFFKANFPDNFMGTNPALTTVTPTFTQRTTGGVPNGILDIKVAATTSAPTYFMRMFNITGITVNATGQATRRALVLVMVLDQSSSMNSNTSCSDMRTAATSFINAFSPYDYIGMVTFESTANLSYAPSTSFKDGTLATKIGAITCFNNTATTAGLNLALTQITNTGLPLALNTIVLFTDGVANGVSAAFPARTPGVLAPATSDDRYGPIDNNANTPAGSVCFGPGSQQIICTKMPSNCTSAGAGGSLTGTYTQVAGVNPLGGDTAGLFKIFNSSPNPTYPPGCPLSGTNLRQSIAYIPNVDVFNNPTNGSVFSIKDNWLFQTNNQCSSDPTVSPSCKKIGADWATAPLVGTGSNFFKPGPLCVNCRFSNPAPLLRPDQPNTIVAVSMNTAVAEANTIRATPNYNIMIHSIYLQGNGGDPIDRDFLPIMTNLPNIPPLTYEGPAALPKTNPLYNPNQPTGHFVSTTNPAQLQQAFQDIASSVLRLSQ